jgi:hypothetical protein
VTKADPKRLVRLQRLEKVRAIAKQAAVTAAAEAEGTLAQLEALAVRTGRMADDYAARSDAADGMSLRQIGSFADGLRGISKSTFADADRARTIADARQIELAMAERRRAAVEERAAREASGIAAQAQVPVLGSRRARS